MAMASTWIVGPPAHSLCTAYAHGRLTTSQTPVLVLPGPILVTFWGRQTDFILFHFIFSLETGFRRLSNLL